VNKGELYVANGDLQMNISQMTQDPNIRIFWPGGPAAKPSTFSLPYYIGLVKGAPHADAGKKLIDFLLSREVQLSVSAVAQGLPVRKDVIPSDEAYKNIHKIMTGVAIWSPDWTEVLKDLPADTARWRQVTGS
jgi:2-aminoethylphosphonate transport system substrate-binding protein